MKIAFFTLSYKTELYGSLIQEFINNGHEVVVINPVYNEKSSFVNAGAIKVLNFKSLPMLNIGLIRKGIANLLFPYMCMRAIKKYLSNYEFDLILMTTPPLAFYQPVKYIKRMNKNALFYLILRDIHPEGAKFIGLDKIRPLFNYFRNIEINLYKMANYVGCMSPGNISFIAEKNRYLDSKKLRMLPNWERQIVYTEPSEEIRVKYNLEDKFIVLFGGNMGIPQNLGILLDLAEIKRNKKDVLFLLVGKGTEKEKLKKQAHDMNLDNVKFMDFIPRADYNELIKICNIGFISLHPNVPIPNIPSKTLSYFNAKLPVLAAVDPITDYGDYMLHEFNAGLSSLSSDFEGLSSNFDTLYNNPDLCKEMGENGYKCLQTHFSPELAYNEIIKACYNEY